MRHRPVPSRRLKPRTRREIHAPSAHPFVRRRAYGLMPLRCRGRGGSRDRLQQRRGGLGGSQTIGGGGGARVARLRCASEHVRHAAADGAREAGARRGCDERDLGRPRRRGVCGPGVPARERRLRAGAGRAGAGEGLRQAGRQPQGGLGRGRAVHARRRPHAEPQQPARGRDRGTQDNGTLAYSGSGTWLNFVSGDGGQAGIDARQGNIRYHTYFNAQGDVNFRGNDPQYWSWIFDPVLFSLEASAFYIPFTADPVVSKTAFAGATHVWRTQNAGGEQDFLENHCSVLGGPRSDRLNTGASSGCGDFLKLGTPSLTGTAYGPATDKGTGYTVAIERARTNAGTLWAATRRGRVFIAKNADSNDPTKVTSAPDPLGTGTLKTQTDVELTLIDSSAQPMRFVSGISIDPRDPGGNTAYLSFSGYNAYAPATPGHVFKAVYDAAHRHGDVDESRQRLGDLPILDVELDPATARSTPPRTGAAA